MSEQSHDWNADFRTELAAWKEKQPVEGESDAQFLRSMNTAVGQHELERASTPEPAGFLTFNEKHVLATFISFLILARVQEARQRSASSPPRAGERLIAFFLPKDRREEMLGCLEEEYHQLQDRYGERFARAWYWKQAVLSIGPVLGAWVREILKFVLNIKLLSMFRG